MRAPFCVLRPLNQPRRSFAAADRCAGTNGFRVAPYLALARENTCREGRLTVISTATGSPTRIKTPAAYGQMNPVPAGERKQPTDSGKISCGSHSTTPGKKIVAAIVAKKIT
jgi:hypothetical protein